MRFAPFLLAAVAALLLAGCVGNAVTISGQGYKTGSESRTLECDGRGQVALGVQGAGKLSVTVTDGAGKTIFSEGGVGAGQDGNAQELTGQPGTWTLKVSTGFGYSGQYGITLSC